MEVEDLTYSRLELCSYRYLQRLAKSMSLPSNVKKIYLIEMIRAKKYCTEEDVGAIVTRIKDERKQLQSRKPMKRKRKRIQEISNGNQSPPISMTPRRPNCTYPSFRQNIIKCRRPSIIHPSITKLEENNRVLRSFNNKQKYRLLNSVFEVIKESSMEDTQFQISMTVQSRPIENWVQSPGDVMDESVESDYAEQSQDPLQENDERQLVPFGTNLNTPQNKPLNKRRLSGIYPILPQETYPELTNIGIHREVGATAVNAIVQKSQEHLQIQKPPVINLARNRTAPIVRLKCITQNVQVRQEQNAPKVVVQDMINYEINHSSFSSSFTEARESTLERESNSNTRRNLALLRKMMASTSENTITVAEYKNNREYAGSYLEIRNITTENQNRDTVIKNNIETQIRDTVVHNRIAAVPDRLPVNNNYDIENINRNTVIRSYDTVDMSRNTDNRGCGIQNVYTDNTKYDTVKINRNSVIRSCNTQNINHYTENKNCDSQNINYDTDRNFQNANIDIQHIYRNTENRNVAESSNRCTEDVNYIIGYPVQNENISSVAGVQNEDVNIERDYPNLSASTEIYSAQVYEVSSTEENESICHKKIQEDQVRTQRCSTQTPVPEGLPHISTVFSRFNEQRYRDLTVPLHVQVPEPEIVNFPPASEQTSECDAMRLERIFNIKREMLSYEPLQPVTTTNGTHCVYSTPVFTTAVVHTPEDNDFDTYLISHSSTNCSQDIEINITIPEMVEDALEIITEDGDYMNRLEMDSRMQCILCEWAGPKIILEYHIRKEHQSEIFVSDGTEWSMVLTLGSLVARDTWLCKPVLHNDNVYVLSAKYDTDCLMASLTVLPTVSAEVLKNSRITVYNKVSGEPHVWQGAIDFLPDTLPYHADCIGLKLDISKLDLLPNSANLKLINGVLVVNSASKVVVGQPELDNIEISLFVQLFD